MSDLPINMYEELLATASSAKQISIALSNLGYSTVHHSHGVPELTDCPFLG